MIRWLRSHWYRRLRGIDLDILWPSCKSQAEDLDIAKACFAFHAFNDDAWLCLGEEGIISAIDELQ